MAYPRPLHRRRGPRIESPMLADGFTAGCVSSFLQVRMIGLVLAGDNAVAVGVVAAALPAKDRKRAILWGLVAAVVTRIAFALITAQLMGLIGLLFAGGLL